MRTREVALALLMLTALAGCSGPKSTPAQTPSQQLGIAKAQLDGATSMHLRLVSSGIPASVDGALGADGSGTHAPAFKGTLDARISGFEATVAVVSIDHELFVKLPFTTAFVQVNPKTYNAPDPAQLFAPKAGISSLLTATTDPVDGAQIRVGPQVLATITGTLPGSTVARLLNVGVATSTFHVTYGITDPGGQLRTVTMTGPFYQGATSTYTLTLDQYGTPVEISKP